ncbi:MAG: formylglycine-generating enzyme family protein [Bacteroidales bacterium]|nr:formylglycine-generating enzyme family protein [Bacteroidales bacterium]
MKLISKTQKKSIALWLLAAIISCTLPTHAQDPVCRVFHVNDIPLRMVFVKGGDMQLGCTAERDDSCKAREIPNHTVSLPDFYMGETEVTQALWMAVMGRDNNPSYWKGNWLPVERVSWAECQRFINRLNKFLSADLPQGYRFALPTEAQWEYAARGGLKSAGTSYSGGNDLKQVAWFYSNSNERTHDVRIKTANELGLFDMSGNVWEWCQDWFDENYYAENKDWNNPLNDQETAYRVQRGGSWNYAAPYQRCANRDRGSIYSRYEDCGFRVALIPK